jgi:TRAP-type mannitol/chloroaromatic compound transport system substrate-binding protein
MVTTWPKNYPGLGAGANRFAKRVEEMSAGRIKIKVYGAKELVPAFEVFDAVRQGSAEMGHGAAYYWKGKHPATPFFTAVPFGLTAQEMNGWLHHGGGQELWDDLYAQFNLKPFACGNTGTQMAGWFNKEINSVDDLKGLKMRMPGLAGEVLAKVGAIPVQLPGAEVFTSLQTGAIDAADWVGPYNDLTFGLHRVAEYYYYPGWQEPGPTLELTINKKVWDSLPADLQAIIRYAAQSENQDMLDEYTARNNAALDELVNKHGTKLRRLPDDVLKALKEASDEVVEALVADNKDARKVYQSYRKFRDESINTMAIAEQPYLNIRSELEG